MLAVEIDWAGTLGYECEWQQAAGFAVSNPVTEVVHFFSNAEVMKNPRQVFYNLRSIMVSDCRHRRAPLHFRARVETDTRSDSGAYLYFTQGGRHVTELAG